jgi:predicted enzyme related to lactoylglutathione lyase
MKKHVGMILLAAALAACGSDSRPQGTTPVTSSTEPTEPSEPAPPAPVVADKPPEPTRPPEPPPPTYLTGKWVWYALETSSIEKSKAFWSELLGWTMESNEMAGMKYELVKSSGKDVASLEVAAGKKAKSRWIPYVSVPDVDAAVKAVEENKGTVVKPAQDVPQIGRFAVVSDPNGAVFALFKGERSDDPDTKAPPQAGTFLWNELWTRNKKAHAASLAFYPAVIGYTTSQMQMGEGKKKIAYDMLSFSEVPRAGVNAASPASLGGQWLPWVAVDDVDAIVAKTRTLKGKVLQKPHDIPTVGRVAVVADTTGAPLGIIRPLTPEEMKAASDAKAAADAAKTEPKDAGKATGKDAGKATGKDAGKDAGKETGGLKK